MIFESLINLGLNFKTFFEVVEVTAANMMAMKAVNKKQISKQKKKTETLLPSRSSLEQKVPKFFNFKNQPDF